jgi:hypothetical protein
MFIYCTYDSQSIDACFSCLNVKLKNEKLEKAKNGQFTK